MNPTPHRRPAVLPLAYVAAFGVSHYTNIIWFHLERELGATPTANLILNALFGLAYTLGCLAMGRASRELTPRLMLATAYALLAGVTVAQLRATSPATLGAGLVAYGFIVAWTWPSLETLMTTGRRGSDLGRAVSRYNLSWAGMSTVTFVIGGWLYGLDPRTLFLGTGFLYVVATLMALRFPPGNVRELGATRNPLEPEDVMHLREDPELASRMRALARVGNLGCYIVLSAFLPVLPFVTKRLGYDDPFVAGAFGSIWALARVGSFVVLGRWHGWHFDRRLFLWTIASIPVCFVALVWTMSPAIAAVAQVGLGFAVGLIYSSSLFYSLHAHKEAHSGEAALHEAVIGAGILLGPIAAALAARLSGLWGIEETVGIGFMVSSIMVAFAGALLWMAYRPLARPDSETNPATMDGPAAEATVAIDLRDFRSRD